MASCEKCWRDADGDVDRYHRLIKARIGRACTAEEQAGDAATECNECGRRTVHQYARVCMACGYDDGRAAP